MAAGACKTSRFRARPGQVRFDKNGLLRCQSSCNWISDGKRSSNLVSSRRTHSAFVKPGHHFTATACSEVMEHTIQSLVPAYIERLLSGIDLVRRYQELSALWNWWCHIHPDLPVKSATASRLPRDSR